MRMRDATIAALVVVAACGPAPREAVARQPAAAPAEDPRAQTGLAVAPLTIRGKGRIHRFTVEIARSFEEQQRGLMFRRNLAADRGMIFPFDPPRPASFWMRNTVLPLDMIFIRADGTIARIVTRDVPLSDESTGVGEPVAAVLEINAGRAARLGITEGDRVVWTPPSPPRRR